MNVCGETSRKIVIQLNIFCCTLLVFHGCSSREFPDKGGVSSAYAHITACICKQMFADKDAEIIEAFNLTSRYLFDLLNIDNTYFDGMVKQIYPSELQLNKANSFVSGFTFDYFRWFCFF